MSVIPEDDPINPSQRRFSRRASKAFPTQVTALQPFTDTETRMLRKLIQLLQDGIDDKDFVNRKNADYGAGDEKAREKQNPLIQGEQKQAQDRSPISRFKNVLAIQELHKRHEPPSRHVRSLLKALGGGNRTAKALKEMQGGLSELSKLLQTDDDKVEINLVTGGCPKVLADLGKYVDEMIEAFKELGIFNTEFFNILLDVKNTAESLLRAINVEYGCNGDLLTVDEGLDSMFEPLAKKLGECTQILTSISEKEIPVIRQSQEFISQQYIDLTTIATFLSSVTATTLQISTSDNIPATALTTVTNSFWFISLAFSAASAVYSLLVMTWRRSPIRQPKRSLPSIANTWLQYGPMFALIIALLTFSIGLCLLAFLVADQQGGVAPAVVPTTFAGIHAYAVFFISTWYLFEHWRTRHPMGLKDTRLGPAFKYVMNVYAMILSLLNAVKFTLYSVLKRGISIKNELSAVGVRLMRFPQIVVGFQANISRRRNGELELGTRHTSNSPDREPDSEERNPDTGVASGTTTDPPHALTTKNDPLESNGYASNFLSLRSRPEDLLHFSPDCTLLASAFANIVTIYRVDNYFKVITTLVIPDESSARQISWNPTATSGDGSEGGHLLVRSANHVYLHNLNWQGRHLLVRYGGIGSTIAPIRWIRKEDNGVDGLTCSLGKSLKVFALPSIHTSPDHDLKNENPVFKELASYDFSGLEDVRSVLDAAFFGQDEIVCLSETRTRLVLLVIDRCTMSIRNKSFSIGFGLGFFFALGGRDVSLTLSQKSERSGKAIIHGSEMAIVCELVSKGVEPIYLDTRAAGCFGKDNDMIYDAEDKKLWIYYSPPFSRVHAIRTQSLGAVAERFDSCAVGYNSESPKPYLFAFSYDDGSVKIWSIQSNSTLHKCDKAEIFKVRDHLYGGSDPVVSTGRYLDLPPPAVPDSAHSDDDEENINEPTE